ncbi:hydrolase [Lithospermum erythrorhizon]|uniref:Hydrolase n=1 Tax=Lithospermum erythrorhizon TaxID=34254 RepID=A0AAV3RSS5_LITER
MGKTSTKMPSFCLNKIRPLVRIRSPSCKNSTSNYEANDNDDVEKEVEHEKSFEVAKPGNVVGRRIMIVIDSSVESKSALQWALTHTVQVHDEVVLLYVKNGTNKGDEENNKEMSRRVSLYLSSMKSLCKQKRPEIKVEVIIAEGKEKGPVIVEEAQKAGVSMLILGQKKRSMTAWRLVMIWAAGNNKATRGGMVEYCIQNATCMAIGVRRKSKKLGGYLITTKRHKDFWLLA